jgi:hypothetical protein
MRISKGDKWGRVWYIRRWLNMPRAARILFPSMPNHIVNRGNNQEESIEGRDCK